MYNKLIARCKLDHYSSEVAYILITIIIFDSENRQVSSVAKRTLSVKEVWGSIPEPVNSTQCRQRLAIIATFLRRCVIQALNGGDGHRHPLHASTYYREYNQDLIFFKSF